MSLGTKLRRLAPKWTSAVVGLGPIGSPERELAGSTRLVPPVGHVVLGRSAGVAATCGRRFRAPRQAASTGPADATCRNNP
jgi:hypothetical protein